jgi:tetratricopeptide (TPR) repeat protein
MADAAGVSANEDASSQLRAAHVRHDRGDIAGAVAAARAAVAADPGYVEAWSYLGTTLVTRALHFEDGLAALEHARDLAPDDPSVLYNLGWCYEFVAYRLEKEQAPYRDPVALYELAADALQRCIERETDAGMRDDAEKLRDTIVSRF